jgi:putative addiction module killer protein
MKIYEIEAYVSEDGSAPFNEWLDCIKDKTAKTKLYARIERASYGNFGDWKSIKGVNGLFEMREHYGSGYRIFYTIVEQKIVLILAGSVKSEQDKVIIKASNYLATYKRRVKL